MDISLCNVELFVGKIDMGEDKNQNCIGPLPHDFRVNLHQNNPLRLVVLQPVWLLIANWLDGLNELWHHLRDSIDSGTELRQLRRHSVKKCQREDGLMRSMPWYISLWSNTQGFKNKNSQLGLCETKIETNQDPQTPWPRNVPRNPSLLPPLKRQRYDALQLVTLKVWS